MAEGRFTPLDWLVFFAYQTTLVLVGWYFSRRQTTTEEFFTSSRRMHWLPVALAVVASMFSAISFIGHPAKVFKGDCVMIVWPLAVLIATPLVIHLLLPFYSRLRVTTAYEYLEKRFGLNVRLLASALFLLKRLFWMALVALTPSLALSAMTGLRVEYCVLIIGLIATLYTSIGGLSAVIWNDAIQFVVFMVGQVLIIVYAASRLNGGFAEIWHRGIADHKIAVDMSVDFSRQTFWTALLACVFIALCDLGADQLVVQRLMSAKDTRSAARSLWFNSLFKFPSILILLGMGAALWTFYAAYPHLLGLAPKDYEKVIPYFIITQLPAGISGLVISGIFAAAMSGFTGGLSSLVTTLSVDWYARLIRPGQTDQQYLRHAKALTFVLGAAVTLLALIICWTGIRGLVDASNSFLALFGGGLLGIFLLGVLTRRAKGRPTVIGAIVAIAATCGFEAYQTFYKTRILDPWMYGGVICTLTMLIGYFGSFFGPELPYEKVAGYTMARGPRSDSRDRSPAKA